MQIDAVLNLINYYTFFLIKRSAYFVGKTSSVTRGGMSCNERRTG